MFSKPRSVFDRKGDNGNLTTVVSAEVNIKALVYDFVAAGQGTNSLTDFAFCRDI